MSISLVESFLDELAKYLLYPPQEGKDAAAVAQDLSAVVLNDVTKEEMPLVASMLFKGEEKSVLHFLRNTMDLPKHKELAACRAEVVDLVDKMVALLGAKSISEYAASIRECCYWVFRREQSAKVKATSLDPIVSIVELNLSRFDAESLQIKEMSDGMVKEYASSKTSATVKSAILQTLGIFSEFFPTEMKDRVSMLVPAILDDLQNQFKSSKKPDQKLIAGAIRGLASILVHFSSQITTDETKMQRTHTCAIACGLELPEGVRTFDTLKASLAFVARHAGLFKRYLTQEYQKIYIKLKTYCSHGNRAVRRAAFPALDAFLTEVAGEIGSNQQRSYEANIAAFKYFMNEFFQGFDSNAAGIYEISVAIRGFGKFAKVTRRMMGVAQVKHMLDKLVGFSDRFYSGAALSVGGEGLEDAVSHLPNFIIAFANIFLELDVSTTSEDSEELSKGAVSLMTYVDHLERLVGAFFLSYPQMYDHQRYPNYIALARLFASLYLKGPMALRVLLTRVMFQGLTLTCSKPIDISNARDASGPVTENYFEYQDLWKNILSPKIPEDFLTQESFGAEQSKQLQTIIFDQFIEALIKVQQKLSLEYVVVKVTEKGVEKPVSPFSPQKKTAPPTVSASAQNAQPPQSAAEADDEDDPEVADRVKPSVPKDFELFLNLVEFCRLILPQLQPQSRFDKWLYVYTRELILKSNQYPLVSGFYKLLSIALKISDKTRYFSPNRKPEQEKKNAAGSASTAAGDDAMDVDTEPTLTSLEPLPERDASATEAETRQICFILVNKFIREVLARMRQYKDELLGSCLQLVLSVPREFIDVESLVSPLQTAFRLGLAYLPLCEIGLDALEYWIRVKRNDVLRALPKILPCLSEYLSMSGALLRDSPAGALGVGAQQKEAIEYKAEHDRSLQSTLQVRIVRLLGKLGGHNLALVPEFDLEQLMAWDSEKDLISLQLPLSQTEAPFDVSLDDIMPRVCFLAESGSDRQAKVAACEFLHAITIYLVGRRAQHKVDVSYENVYKHIFPVIIRLSVDVEQITRQLFEPLAFQLVRWFTKNQRAENKETIALLESIIDAAGNPTDGALRETSAKLLTEFLKWSIKHAPPASKSSEDSSPFNALSLFKRLYSMASHPSPYKRLGCALALKQMYRVFREDENLVSLFVLEMAHVVLVSLRHATNDSEALGTVQLYTQVLEALGRIIVAYKVKLSKEEPNRRMHKSLASLLRFVFSQCGRPERPVRHAAFTMFHALVLHIPGHKTPGEWVTAQIGKSAVDTHSNVREAVVKFFDDPNLLRRVPDMPASDEVSARQSFVVRVQNWYQHLGASLDGLVWLLSSELITPDVLLGGAALECARPMSMANAFVEKFAMIAVDDAVFSTLTPAESEKFNAAKCYLLMRVFKLHLVLAEKFKSYYVAISETRQGPMASKAFFFSLFLAVLAPHQLGFPTSNPSQMGKLSALVQRLCRVLVSSLPNNSQKRRDFLTMFASRLEKDDFNFLQYGLKHSTIEVERTRNLARGYQTLHGTGVLNVLTRSDGTKSFSQEKITQHLLRSVFDNCSNYSPLEMVVISSVLQLCFSFDSSLNLLLELLLDVSTFDIPARSSSSGALPQEPVAGGSVFSSKISTRAETFYSSFRDPIDEFLIAQWSQVAKQIMTSLHRSNLMLRVFLSIADRHHMFPKKYVPKRFLEPTFTHIATLGTWASPTSSPEQRDNLLEMLKKLVKVSPSFILSERRDSFGMFVRDCVVSFLSRESALPLPFKTEVLDLMSPILTHAGAAAVNKATALQFLAPIRTAVRNIIVYSFPTLSTDYPELSATYGQYVDALNALLTALSSSCSLLLLEELFPILRESDHRHIARIDQELALFVHNLSDERAREAFDVCLKSFHDLSLSDDLRLALIRKLCLPIMKKLSTTLLIDAISSHIHPLMRIVSQCKIEDSITQPVITLDKSTVVTRLGVFYIIEAAFRLLPDSIIRDRITKQAYMKNDVNSKGSEVTSDVIKAAHFVKAKIKVDYAPDVSAQLALELHCTAYNALASVISCTQKQDKFYTVFCFSENPMKKELLWENIVDLSASHRFEVETNFAIANRDISALYSKAMQKQLTTTANASSSDTYLRPKTRFMSSEYLADSSLSQEVSNSAFFTRPERHGYGDASADNDAMDVDQPAQVQRQNEVDAAAAAAAAKKKAGSDEAIELDAFNSNPCMMAILNLLDDMVAKFGAEWTAAQPKAGMSIMPAWMKAMLEKFKDSRAHLNIRLFLVKVIVNKPEVFQPYADHWFKPILSFVIADEISQIDPMAAPGFHYFLRDICLTLLRWEYVPAVAVMEEQRLAVQFVEILMKRCFYPVQRVVQSNIQIVRLFVGRWQGALMRAELSKHVPFEYITRESAKSNAKTKVARTIGMQLLDLMLVNNFDIYDVKLDAGVNKNKFFDAIMGNLLFGSVTVYKPTALVIGLALNRSRPQPTLRAEIEQLARIKVNALFEKDDQIRLFHILEKICTHEPEFVDSFFKKIFNMFRRLRGDAKQLALQLILLRANDVDKEEMFMAIQPRLNDLLKHKEGECQAVTLRILKALCPMLNFGHVTTFVDTLIESFEAHSDEKTREEYYLLLQLMYDNFAELRASIPFRLALLKGLADESPDISKSMFAFWDTPSRLDAVPLERLKKLVADLYSSDVERHWVRYACVLLLKLCERSHTYEAKLLSDLEKAEFKDVYIDASYAYRPQAMTPLFSPDSQYGSSDFLSFSASQDVEMADMFSSQSSDGESSAARRIAAGGGVFKATQQPVFQQTQSAAPGGTFDVGAASQFGYSQNIQMNQFRAVTFSMGSSSSSATQASDGSTFKKPGLPARRPGQAVRINATQADAMDVDEDYGNSSDRSGGSDSSSVTVWKRFMKTPQGAHHPSYFFARQNLKKVKMEQALQRERARQRLHQVTLFRKYRQGELPDTAALTPKSFVEPLMALASRDDIMARLSLSRLFQKVSAGRFQELRGPLQRMLDETTSSSTAFVYWLLRVLYDSFDSEDDAGKSAMWDPLLLGTSALKSINFHMGAMTIEKQILLSQRQQVRPSTAKRRAAGEPPAGPANTLEAWLQLSKIYKSLVDDDVVLSIYSKNLSSLQETKSALEKELVGKFDEALALYEKVLSKVDRSGGKADMSSTELELLEDSRLDCMAKLTDWNVVFQNAATELGQNPVASLWKRGRDRDVYLYAYLHGALMVKEQRDDAFRFVDKSLATSQDAKDVLERDFAPDLAFMNLIRDDLGKARYYITKAYHDFMREWASLPEIATQGRQSKLLRLQRLVEMEEMLDFVSYEWSFSNIKHLRTLMKAWRKRDPSLRDSVVHWDDVASQRDAMIYKIRDHFSSLKKDAKAQSRVDSNDLAQDLMLAKVDFARMVARGALKQGNFNVCDKALKKAQRVAKSAKGKNETWNLNEYDNEHYIIKSFLLQARSKSEPSQAAALYSRMLNWIQAKEQSPHIIENFQNRRRFIVVASETRAEMYSLSREYPDIVHQALENVNFEPLVKAPSKWDAKQTPKRLIQLAYQGMHEFMKAQEAQQQQDENDLHKIAKSHLQMSHLLELLVKHQLDTKENILADIGSALKKIITHTMTAIRMGSRHANETVPRLLQVLATDTKTTGQCFMEQAALLEPWMLLRWVGNMLALLSKPEGDYLVPALEAIADAYPQAVYYQFKITYESLPQQARRRAERLAATLRIDVLEDFIAALHKMTNPMHRLNDWKSIISTLIKKKDAAAVKDAAAKMMADIADPKAAFLGSANRQFANAAAPILSKALGAQAEKLASMTEQQYATEVTKLFASIKDPSSQNTGRGKLSEYSMWLTRYDSSEHPVPIEIPGQYGGFRKPQPELHVKISSFDPSILVMSSMRRPKRLTVRGDDEKEHNFLVKGGEDLRLDQRVEQLFEVMNEIFANNSATQKRRMNIHTYQVVPMTSRVGMIEWVNGTKPLKSILEDSIKLQGADVRKVAEKIHDEFIHKHSKSASNPGDQYRPMFVQAKREEAVSKMKRQLEEIPPTLVRDGLMRLSPDPEAFIALRQRAAVSTAVFSVSSYIIGIGDRHLDNFLLNLKNGEVIGIDFGHAFGSATLVLPIPELVPFRMTPQVLGMILPLDAETVLKYNMVHALNALHDSRQTLLNFMDVFINEPLVDWQTYMSRTAAREKFGGDQARQLDWFARRRIEIVKQKLNLRNPGWITADDLAEGAMSDQSAKKALMEHAKGYRDFNARGKIGEYCANVQEQVDCLMDQATDYNILGRAWKGWSAWL